MATRQTRFQLKNNQNSAAPFSGATLLVGEPIVNTAAGIMMFSGVTTGGIDWTPAGPGGNAAFFEVGSNLYDLRLRNRITKYEGVSGLGLVGKILSGTTSGLTLVDATNINGISAFTYTPSANTFTIIDSNGTEYPATFTTVSGLTVNGDFTVTGNTFLNFLTANTISATTITVDDITINDDASVSGDLTVNNLNVTGTTTISGGITADTISATTITTDDIYINDDAFVSGDLTVHNLTVTGSTVLNTVTASTISATTITSDDINVNDDVNIGGDLNVTGNTILNFVSANIISATTITSDDINVNDDLNVGGDVNITGNTILNTLTANTISATTITVDDINVNDDANIGGDLNVTGNTVMTFFTGGTGTINGNLTITGNTSITSLQPNLVVYTNPSNVLSTELGFGYDESNNLLTVDNLQVNNTTSAATFGVGGVVIGSGGSLTGTGTGDLVVHGSLTVFGPSISAFTSNLYIEDNNIILNYNPTGSTAASSVNSGFQIQDGSGTSGSSVNLDVVRLRYLTGLTPTEIPVVSEYTSDDGYVNRGWITQLNDIVIRSTDVVDDGINGSITGVRVLAEFDVLDGGTY